MVELIINNEKVKLNIKSEDVKNILQQREDFEYVQDISNTINQKNTMVFDCQLGSQLFNLQEIEDIVEEGELIDESYFNILFEDIRAYLKDATDEIEVELQEEYSRDNIRCFFDIYNIDETFTDFKFVFIISFDEIKISSLTNLCKIVGERQLVGASKFYS